MFVGASCTKPELDFRFRRLQFDCASPSIVEVTRGV